jgi:hypothetical protein
MFQLVSRNTYTNTNSVRTNNVYGFNDVRKYMDTMEE